MFGGEPPVFQKNDLGLYPLAKATKLLELVVAALEKLQCHKRGSSKSLGPAYGKLKIETEMP